MEVNFAVVDELNPRGEYYSHKKSFNLYQLSALNEINYLRLLSVFLKNSFRNMNLFETRAG